MCSRGSSQIIKIALVMLISGILLSGKGPKTYKLGLCFFFFLPLKGTTSILTHFRSTSPSPGQRPAAKNKDLLLPPPVKKKVICPRRPPPLMFRP